MLSSNGIVLRAGMVLHPSHNIEMLEVTGGKFWKPYRPELDSMLENPRAAAPAKSGGNAPAGMDARVYRYHPPIDLMNARLRKLAPSLGVASVSSSGTWANTSYFPGGIALLLINTDRAAPRTLAVPSPLERCTLATAGSDLQTQTLQLNRTPIALGANDALPSLEGAKQAAGDVAIAPATVTFPSLPQGGNSACR